MGGNPKLKNIKQLEPLKHLKIQILDLAGTPLSEQKTTREKVFAEFKDLLILDQMDKDGNEVEEMNLEDEGEFGESELDEIFEGEGEEDEEEDGHKKPEKAAEK